MENTKIEWCDATVNFWWGCTKVSAGCANCYADSMAHRWGKDIWGKENPREDHRVGATKLALKLNHKAYLEASDAEACGRDPGPRPRVFCSSMSDWLDDEVPVEWLADLLDVICRTPHLDWLLLSKRPENWRARLEMARDYQRSKLTQGILMVSGWLAGVLPANAWIGTSVENQEAADKRIPELLKIPAKVRFLSCEPLLGPVDLDRWIYGTHKSLRDKDGNPPARPNWIICGGESGQHARPMNPEWARSLRDQCQTAGVTFFMKQMGGTRKPFSEIPEDLNIKQFPKG